MRWMNGFARLCAGQSSVAAGPFFKQVLALVARVKLLLRQG